VRPVDTSRVQGTFGQAGQRFQVSLDQPIDTLESVRRGTFTAHVVSPILGSDGRVLVPAGAAVTGEVRSLGSLETPYIRVRFDTVETVHGAAPLQARLRAADYHEYMGPWITGYDVGYRSGYAWGGGPSYANDWYYVAFRPTEVRLPAGARLDLVLTRPLVPPGSAVLPH